MRKAQVTAFIVIGLFLLLVFLVILNLVLTKDVNFVSSSELFDSYKSSVSQCVEQQAVLSLFLVFEKFGNYTDLPGKEVLQNMITEELSDNIVLCRSEENSGVEVGEHLVDVSIENKSVAFDVKMPVKLMSKDQIYFEDDFSTVIPLGLSELYERVKSITEHNKSLDLSFLLGQRLDIEIIGCDKDRIRYLINDKSYRVEDAIVQFFFATGFENLIELFEFENDLRFLVPTMGGKHVLRQAGNEKRLVFDAGNDGIVDDCFKKFEGHEYYSFGLVDNNTIPAMFTVLEPRRVDIRRISVGENDEFIPVNSFEFSSVYEVTPAKVAISGEGELFYENNDAWTEVDSIKVDGYNTADVTKLGKYATGIPICYSEDNAGLGLNFIASDYDDINLFREHVFTYSKKLESLGLKTDLNAFFKNTAIDCSAWQSKLCMPSFVHEADECGNDGLTVVLIDNPRFGFDHRIADEVIYLGSYLADNSSYCAECYLLYELGNYYGVDVTGLNMTPEEMNVNSFKDVISEIKVKIG